MSRVRRAGAGAPTLLRLGLFVWEGGTQACRRDARGAPPRLSYSYTLLEDARGLFLFAGIR